MNEAPKGKMQHRLYGYAFRYDWSKVEHLLGKQTDASIAAILGCTPTAVRNLRRRLGIKRFRKADRVKKVMGRHPDKVVAELTGVARETVARTRRAAGVPPCPRRKYRDLIRVRRLHKQLERKEIL